MEMLRMLLEKVRVNPCPAFVRAPNNDKFRLRVGGSNCGFCSLRRLVNRLLRTENDMANWVVVDYSSGVPSVVLLSIQLCFF